MSKKHNNKEIGIIKILLAFLIFELGIGVACLGYVVSGSWIMFLSVLFGIHGCSVFIRNIF